MKIGLKKLELKEIFQLYIPINHSHLYFFSFLVNYFLSTILICLFDSKKQNKIKSISKLTTCCIKVKLKSGRKKKKIYSKFYIKFMYVYILSLEIFFLYYSQTKHLLKTTQIYKWSNMKINHSFEINKIVYR